MDELAEWDMAEIPDDLLSEELLNKKLPPSLYQFYDFILERNKPQSLRSSLFVILKWILVASRPLTVAELIDACATLPSENREFDRHLRNRIKDFPSRLTGLISVNQSIHEQSTPLGAAYIDEAPVPITTRTVTFAHFSVKEYLTDSTPRSWTGGHIRINICLAQLYAAQCCLAYLKECQRDAAGRTSAWPFRSYAWRNWAIHAMCSVAQREWKYSTRDRSQP